MYITTIMWRASKRIVVDCFWSLARCLNPASIINDLEDISIYEIEDIPGNFIYKKLKNNTYYNKLYYR